MIVVVPSSKAVTNPELSTLAIVGFTEYHLRSCVVTLSGENVGFNCNCVPLGQDVDEVFNDSVSAKIATIISHSASKFEPTVVEAYILTFPGEIPVTLP